MNDLGKTIDSMVKETTKAEVKPTIPQKPAAPKPEISEKAGFGNVKVVDDKTLTFTGSDNKPWTIKQNEILGFDVYDSTGKKVVSDVNANRESIAEKISSLVKS